jgi:hypothetical protein
VPFLPIQLISSPPSIGPSPLSQAQQLASSDSDNASAISAPQVQPASNSTLIRVAILMPRNSNDYGLSRNNSDLRNSGGAITLALERLWSENVLPKGLNFTWDFGKLEIMKNM